MRQSIFLLPILMVGVATAAESKKNGQDAPAESAKEPAAPAVVETPPVVRESSVEIGGRKVPYKVTAGKIQLKKDDGKTRASIFHVSYERSDVTETAERPVMFAFNGGPGSSAVWLHLGVLGPRIIRFPDNGTSAPEPPARLADNPMSILDVCDLVFIDPVSTGYSRAENDTKPGDFHGLEEDIESVGDFIRRWITEHGRWGSPKYLLGESYGGVRAAGLSHHLQSRYGMSLNGVVLLSSLLDFATIQPAPGNDLAHLVFLPSFTGTAHFHKKIDGPLDSLLEESEEFAFGGYASALLKGIDLDDGVRDEVAAKLERFSGIPAATWIKHDLRVSPAVFRNELLRDQGKVLGRFDGRVAWNATDKSASTPGYDPSLSLALGPFSTAMMDYLGRELGYEEDQPYEILTGKVWPWRWNTQNQVVNLADQLATAMRDNPHLRVLVMGGRTDLATPPEGVAHSLRHLPNLPDGARERIRSVHYGAGHMFYLNPADLEKTRADLLDFLRVAP